MIEEERMKSKGKKQALNVDTSSFDNALNNPNSKSDKKSKQDKVKKKGIREFDADSECAKELKLKEAMDRAFARMLKETEIRYILNLLKE